jgi:ATP-dependent DNA helicase RecQ
MERSRRTHNDAELSKALHKHFGFSSFRANQEEIVRAILRGRDVFAAMPTGGGKSLCYQLPALIEEGLTVVVSPLISLMKDQVDGARKNGIPASFLNSSLSAEEAAKTRQELTQGRIKLLYVSPERLSIPDFRQRLESFGLSLIAVDEAHCISEWGHEFRPDYRALGLLRNELPDVPIAAFTATATRQVQDDVVRLLGLKEPFIVRASFDRPEIFYRVIAKEGSADVQLLDFIRQRKGQPGIVYRSTRKAVEKTASFLCDHGVSAAAYHAGIEDEDRKRRQEAFVKDEVLVVVATIAFGMGIDKSNVRWVLHGDLPRSIEGYYQETGRAARDGERADTALFFSPGDIASIRWHIDKIESPVERTRAEASLRDILRYVESSGCRRRQLLAHFGEEHPGNCGRCDVCAGEIALEDLTEDARKALSAAVRTGERFGAHHLADIVVGNATDKVMERGHHMLPTFGIGKEHDKNWWLSLIRELAAGDYLLRGEGETAGFHLSARGRLLLNGKESFLASRPTDRAGHAKERPTRERTTRERAAGKRAAIELPARAEQASITAPDDGTSAFHRLDEDELFQCLKRVRSRIARAREVPPYVVFSDKTLRVFVKNRPTDSAALLRCHGVGDFKLEEYGDAFLKAIREFSATGGCTE